MRAYALEGKKKKTVFVCLDDGDGVERVHELKPMEEIDR